MRRAGLARVLARGFLSLSFHGVEPAHRAYVLAPRANGCDDATDECTVGLDQPRDEHLDRVPLGLLRKEIGPRLRVGVRLVEDPAPQLGLPKAAGVCVFDRLFPVSREGVTDGRKAGSLE